MASLTRPVDAKTAFAITTRNPVNGQRIQKLITTLTDAEVDERLKTNEQSVDLSDKKDRCIVARYDVNSVAANDPIEDRTAQIIVERDSATRARSASLRSESTAEEQEAISEARDLAFFAIMDGHAGFQTSSYLSQKLIAFVAIELDKVFRETGEYADMAKAKASMPGKLWRAVVEGGSSSDTASPADPARGAGLDWDPEVVKRAISKAFVGLDKEICNTPVELLKEYELAKASSNLNTTATSPDATRSSGRSLSTLAHSIFPTPGSATSGGDASMTATQKSAYEIMLPALSGSCALLTYIDSATRDVYVACTGDSRAIGGWHDTRTGKWTIEPLSEDQTGRNPSEAARMRKEHPASETDNVVMRGRVLGGLEPTRAFGDARYKWTRDIQERLHSAFLSGGQNAYARGPPKLLQTPPYVTARPVVEWRRLTPPAPAEGDTVDAAVGAATIAGDTVRNSNPRPSVPTKQLKFIVMATDGLWDMLSNEDVGILVAGHIEQVKGSVRAKDLESRLLSPKPTSLAFSLSNVVSSAVGGVSPGDRQSSEKGAGSPAAIATGPNANNGHRPLARGGLNEESVFTFEDSNLATHLVRNALGGANRLTARALLAIPAPDARRYRDDITVTVILLNEQDAQQQIGQGRKKETRGRFVQEVKTKL